MKKETLLFFFITSISLLFSLVSFVSIAQAGGCTSSSGKTGICRDPATGCQPDEISAGTADCSSGILCCIPKEEKQETEERPAYGPQTCNIKKVPGVPAGELGVRAQGIQTAIGCIPTDIKVLIPFLLPWLFGIAGGIAFLLILFGAFQILTSAGNPEKVQNGQQIITNAVIGLLFIIFSVFIINLVGEPIMSISGE